MKRILITNDDGIQGKGLYYLAEFAQTLGEVTVVAPVEERSACSQSIIIRRPIELKKTDLLQPLNVEAYTLDSMPADCVRIALNKLGRFDLVLSGINNGYNTGHYISYSGTCSAIFEASYEGVPAIGFSCDIGLMKEASKELPRIFEFLDEHDVLSACPLLNINIPPNFRDFRITRQKLEYLCDTFVPCGNGAFKAEIHLDEWLKRERDLRDDMDAFFENYCSITPLHVDRTDHEAYEKLQVLNR